MIFSLHISSLYLPLCFWFIFENYWFYIFSFSPLGWLLSINISIIYYFSILAIVPIEYFSERNGAGGGSSNVSKIKSLNEENRVWSNSLFILLFFFFSFHLIHIYTHIWKIDNSINYVKEWSLSNSSYTYIYLLSLI